MTGTISDPNVRERIVSWEQDTCKDLAPRFREMMLSRARVAHLKGFKSFFEYRSQFKMMNTTSVDLFLKDLKSKIDRYANAFMESAIEQKMNDLGYDFTIKNLRERLRRGKTIRDYQNNHPEAQINWGDYSYYTTLKSKFISKSKQSEDLKFHEYFPMDHSMRRVLSIFGDLLGLTFHESPPGDQRRQVPIATYLRSQNLTEHNTALDVFWVFDITGITPKRLGSLILDVGEREGKPRKVFCTTFGTFLFENEISRLLPGVAIVGPFIKPTSRSPFVFNHQGLSTFAHELAHAIHRLVQGGNKPFITGPRDFVEIPSITAEKWTSNPVVLQRISCHYTYLEQEYLTAWKDGFSPKIPPPQPPRQAPLEMFNEIHYKKCQLDITCLSPLVLAVPDGD
ncbi:zincin [Hyaloscypha hepaticicola]|uniref:Zincin n=1 Tax=Hyaloscypha hepaticicola TaxID=2082293 RepID=A0A2J6Q0M8_9HELO|nr:zincin [Hyaloscypha hepaticicola]